jgi:hypothetical protein
VRGAVERSSRSCQLAPSTSLLTRRFHFRADGPQDHPPGRSGRNHMQMAQTAAPSACGATPDVLVTVDPGEDGLCGMGLQSRPREIQLVVTQKELEVERANLAAERARGAAAVEMVRIEAERARMEEERARNQLSQLEYEAAGGLPCARRPARRSQARHQSDHRIPAPFSPACMTQWPMLAVLPYYGFFLVDRGFLPTAVADEVWCRLRFHLLCFLSACSF